MEHPTTAYAEAWRRPYATSSAAGPAVPTTSAITSPRSWISQQIEELNIAAPASDQAVT